MTNIPEINSFLDGRSNISLKYVFKSKKNTVFQILMNDKPRVVKIFKLENKKNMENEYNILKKDLNKINIPKVYEIDYKNGIILMEHINGKNLCDVINDRKISIYEKEKIMISLADWHLNFHNRFKKNDEFTIRGDSILRNFISSRNIFGVDFEESRIGSPFEDVASICSSILTTDPMFLTEKFILSKLFTETYVNKQKYSIDDINEKIAFYVRKNLSRRRINYSNMTLKKIISKLNINDF